MISTENHHHHHHHQHGHYHDRPVHHHVHHHSHQHPYAGKISEMSPKPVGHVRSHADMNHNKPLGIDSSSSSSSPTSSSSLADADISKITPSTPLLRHFYYYNLDNNNNNNNIINNKPQSPSTPSRSSGFALRNSISQPSRIHTPTSKESNPNQDHCRKNVDAAANQHSEKDFKDIKRKENMDSGDAGALGFCCCSTAAVLTGCIECISSP